jgi:hypothetical protein
METAGEREKAKGKREKVKAALGAECRGPGKNLFYREHFYSTLVPSVS